MDYAIAMQNGRGAMTFDKADTIFNNVYLSLTVRKGSFFANPEFGSRLHLLRKNTARTAALAEAYAKEALQWLIDTVKATTIEVTAQRNVLSDPCRLKLLVEVTQSDGQNITFEVFVEVV